MKTIQKLLFVAVAVLLGLPFGAIAQTQVAAVGSDNTPVFKNVDDATLAQKLIQTPCTGNWVSNNPAAADTFNGNMKMVFVAKDDILSADGYAGEGQYGTGTGYKNYGPVLDLVVKGDTMTFRSWTGAVEYTLKFSPDHTVLEGGNKNTRTGSTSTVKLSCK